MTVPAPPADNVGHLVKLLDSTKDDVVWASAQALTRHENAIVDHLQARLDADRRSILRKACDFISKWFIKCVDPFGDSPTRWVFHAGVSRALARIASARAIALLGRMLAESDLTYRYLAAQALGQVGTPSAATVLMGKLGTADSHTRQEIVRSLVHCEGSHVVEILSICLMDGEADIRCEAAIALEKLADPSTEEALGKALDDPVPRVSVAVAAALGALRTPGAFQILKTCFEQGTDELLTRVAITLAMGRQTEPESISLLEKALKDPLLAWAAVQALGRSSLSEAIGLLAGVLHSPDVDLRVLAAIALGEKRGIATAADPLAIALGDGCLQVRVAACKALGQICAGRAIELLERAMRDQHEDVRSMAAAALARNGNAGTRGVLTGLSDPSAAVRCTSAASLALLNGPDVEEALARALLRDPDRHVRVAAAQAIPITAKGALKLAQMDGCSTVQYTVNQRLED